MVVCVQKGPSVTHTALLTNACILPSVVKMQRWTLHQSMHFHTHTFPIQTYTSSLAVSPRIVFFTEASHFSLDKSTGAVPVYVAMAPVQHYLMMLGGIDVNMGTFSLMVYTFAVGTSSGLGEW